MKNISLTVSPYTQPVYPAPPMPAYNAENAARAIPNLVYSVTLSAQFENEAEALSFATKLINVVTGDAE